MKTPFNSYIYIVDTRLSDLGVGKDERSPITIDLSEVESYFHVYESDDTPCTRVQTKSERVIRY